VKVGDRVIKNQKAYTIMVGNNKNEPPFQEEGTIDSLADVKVGETIAKNKVLIYYSNYVFNRNLDLKKIGEVPGQDGLLFDIFTKKIDRNGVKVDVIEVKDPKPRNPARRESNEQKTRKPLRFGSRVDVSTSGNWE
jgi:hypothetical protein